jgi:hypothetical protein
VEHTLSTFFVAHLGNIITVAVTVGAILIAGGRVKQQLIDLTGWMKKLDSDVGMIRHEVVRVDRDGSTALKTHVTGVTRLLDGQDDRLTKAEAGVQELKAIEVHIEHIHQTLQEIKQQLKPRTK